MSASNRKPEKFCNYCGLISFGEKPSGAQLSPPGEALSAKWANALSGHFRECNRSTGSFGCSDFGRGRFWDWLPCPPEVQAAIHLAGYDAGAEMVIKDLIPVNQAVAALQSIK